MEALDMARYVSVAEAARRLGVRGSEARAYLRRRGLIRRICGRPRVWLADLAELDDDSATPTSTTKTTSIVLPSWDDVPAP